MVYLFLLAAFTLPAPAHWVVVDPANLVQTTVTALRSLQQIENQVQPLTNEALMLENGARNLKSLNFNSSSQLQATLATTNQLIAQAQGIGFYPLPCAATVLAVLSRELWHHDQPSPDGIRCVAAIEQFPERFAVLSQATNPLLALEVRQALQDQQLRVTQDRATALEQVRAVAAEVRARTIRLQFSAQGTNYTPQPVQFYGQ